MADTLHDLPEDRILLAGEHVLGVIEGEDAHEARRLLLSDRGFAEAVAWWEQRLGAMGEAAGSIAPPSEVWHAIEARIRAENDNWHTEPRRSTLPASPWSLAALAGGVGLAVASLVLFLAAPGTPPIAPEQSGQAGPQLIAQIADEAAERRIATVIDRDRERLSLRIDGLEAAVGQTPELWVIPEGGTPVSLGAIPQAGAFERALEPGELDLLVDGSTLAVTFEEDTGMRHEEPTPPILLAGRLDEI